MTTSEITPAGEALLRYLVACGGTDRIECWNAAGNPDSGQARVLAEDLRARLGGLLDEAVVVEQSGGAVSIRTIRRQRAAV